MAGQKNDPPAPPANPPAPPTPPPPAPPPAPPAPPTPPYPPAPVPVPDISAHLNTLDAQLKQLADRIATIGQPAPRDPLAEIDQLKTEVEGVTAWRTHRQQRRPNWFQRLVMGVLPDPDPPAPPAK